MDLMKKVFNLSESNLYPIVIAQYERDDYSVNNPEQLHWAILVVQDAKLQKGPVWQAIDMHYSDGRFEWQLSTGSVKLGSTTKCLGGVCIGYLPRDNLSEFSLIVSSNVPVPKFQGWNCRDWIMEVVEMLKKDRWIEHYILDQSTLFPIMHLAGIKTHKRRAKGKPTVKILPFVQNYLT
ncbi:hypothetical protein H0H87_009824 [Tephrocybe sp. NHM501043]|nr:hypothetical protein H0H87_009824 [Tephrocybe sp. NHM501043]